MSVKSIHMTVMTMLSALIPLVALPVHATLDTLEMEPFAVSCTRHQCITRHSINIFWKEVGIVRAKNKSSRGI